MGKFFKLAVSKHVVREALKTLKKQKVELSRNWMLESMYAPKLSYTRKPGNKGTVIITKKGKGAKNIGYKSEERSVGLGGRQPKRTDMLLHELGHVLAATKGTKRKRRRMKRVISEKATHSIGKKYNVKTYTKNTKASEKDANREAIKFIKKHSKNPKKDLKSYNQLELMNNVSYKQYIKDIKKMAKKEKELEATFSKTANPIQYVVKKIGKKGVDYAKKKWDWAKHSPALAAGGAVSWVLSPGEEFSRTTGWKTEPNLFDEFMLAGFPITAQVSKDVARNKKILKGEPYEDYNDRFMLHKPNVNWKEKS